MFTQRAMLAVCGAAVLGIALTAPVKAAGPERHTTYLTFSGPFALPGVSLVAGTYVFERASPTEGTVIQVLSRDRSKIHYLGFTMRAERPHDWPTDRVVQLEETRPGSPVRLKRWFPIGELRGYEFVYRQ